MAADRVARPRGARRRPQRGRQGGLHRGRVAGRAGPGRRCAAARTTGSRATLVALARESAQRVVPRCPHFGAAAPAAAARCSTCDVGGAGRGQAARARGQPLAPRQGAARDACCGRSRARPGATAGARAFRCATSQEGDGAGRLPRAQVQLSSPTSRAATVLPRACQRAAAAAARADRGDGRSATACRRSSSRSATASTALVLRHLEPLTSGDLRAAARVRARARRRSGGCSRKGPDTVAAARRRRPGAGLRAARVRHARCRSGRPTSRRSTRRSTRCWSSRALRLLDAASRRARDRLVLRPRQLHAAAGDARRARCWASRAARRWSSARARNARRNGLAAQHALRGAQPVRDRRRRTAWRSARADKWLVDPPREGAFALAKALADLHEAGRARRGRRRARIVYVSCNPATLARDAGLLVHQAGYRCSAAGVVNMFPHTAHVESMAVFDRSSQGAA